jgi:hypothetical protein
MRWFAVPLKRLKSLHVNILGLLLVATGSLINLGAQVSAAPPSPAEAFTAQAAFRAARSSGKPVEVLSLTSATTRVWAQPSGVSVAEIHAVPVRLKREGRWLDYDMTLVRRPNGTIEPKVHPRGLALSAAAGAGEHDLATLDINGERLGMAWHGALPEPVLAGPRATYAEAMPGVDLVVEATSAGFEQFFIAALQRRS